MPTNLGIKKGSVESGKEFPQVAGAPPIDKTRETWMVKADSLAQTRDDILATAGIPAYGDTRGNMALKSVNARDVDPDALYWEVDAEWDSRVDGTSQSSDPTLWRPKPKWTTERIELPLQFDQVTGLPIQNSVEEPFFITAPHSVAVRLLTRYENHEVLDYYDDVILAYANKLNSHTFRGWAPWTVLLDAIEVEEETINGVIYARVTYVTKYLALTAPTNVLPIRNFGPDQQAPVSAFELVGWKESLLNHGTKYLPANDDPLEDAKPFEDAHGNPTTGNLNIDGTQLADGSPGVYLRFFRHKLANLNDLGI